MHHVPAHDGDGVHPLDRLGQELTRRGYLVMLLPAGGPARLEIMNRGARRERDGSVLCEAGGGGRWFWWSWAERIAPADAVEEAADQVDRLLRVMEEAA